MTTAVVLREPEATALQNLAQRTGRSADELVREAVQQYTLSDRHALLQQARGMWQHRDDLPSLAELRREYDRQGE